MRIKYPHESLFPQTNTLRFKLSILYVAVIGLFLAFFQAFLYLNYAASVSKEFDTQLKMKADQLGGAINTFKEMLGDQPEALTMAAQRAMNLSIEYPNYAMMSESPEKFWMADAKKLGLDNDFLVIMDSQGGIITKSGNVTPDLLLYFKKLIKPGLDRNMFYKATVGNNVLRIIVNPYNYTSQEGYTMVVGTSYAPVEMILWNHLSFIIGSTLLFLIIASLIVRLFVIRILSSVLEISQVARNISQENLNARIRLKHADQEIEHLTGSLNNMIARLERSFNHVKEFSLEMAHEVKTPLAIISGESQLALQGEHTAQEYKQIIQVIAKEAKRTQRFISDLLLLTRLDYRLIKLRFEPLDLGEFVLENCQRMQVVAAIKGIKIDGHIPSDPMFIQGDKTHLSRVFFNLIDNALKFTASGGHITVSIERNGKRAEVTVTDTGCGIVAQELPRIFNKFHYSDKSEIVDGGCGLGLNIVQSILNLHGGAISVQSQLGKGTTFTLRFPLIVDDNPSRYQHAGAFQSGFTVD